MKVRATVSFSGRISMRKGQEADISPSLAKEYLDCGNLKEVRKTKKAGDEDEGKPDK